MKSNQNTNKITALYCRLSKDDLLGGDSGGLPYGWNNDALFQAQKENEGA